MRDNLAYRETVAFAAKAIIGVSVIVGSGAIVLWSGKAYPHQATPTAAQISFSNAST